MTVLAADHVVTPDEVIDHGWIRIEHGVIAAIGRDRPPGGHEHVGGWLVPGFVDLHMHGGGGHDATTSPADMAAAVAFHRGHGTTATLVSLVTAPVDALCERLSWVADLAGTPSSGVVGAHLEGPFLSTVRCGAQNPEHLIAPDRAATRALIGAARGHLRCMTIAPELPGALDVIDDLRAAGAVAAVGHTDATYEQATAAFRRGATLATHLYNGMRPVHHREPGPVLAALDAGVTCEVINDGVHVHPAVLREVDARGPGRLALITDAIGATGAGDGPCRLGGQAVIVSGGQARLSSTGALAGSTLTLDQAVRRAVRDGLPVGSAVAAASGSPARVLGMGRTLGAIALGRSADVLLLDGQLRLARVMIAGSWQARATAVSHA